MTFAPPLDTIRQEVPEGRTGVVRFWPTITGEGNVTATSASFSVQDQNGSTYGGTQSATIVSVTDVGSRIDCPVSAGSLGLDIDDFFQVTVRWRRSGDTEDRVKGITFDVVKYPFNESTVTYSDLVGARPGSIEVIEHAAERLGLTAAEYASLVGYHARAELDALLRARVEQDAAAYPHVRFLRGHAVLDVNRLKRVEVLVALRELYGRNMTGEPDDDPNAALHAFYSQEVDSAWRSLGRLRYDLDRDGAAESEVRMSSGSVELERRQG